MEVFEKIIDRLKSEVNYNDGAETGLNQSIEIVKQEAEEYYKEKYFNLDHATLHKCPKCGADAEHRVNRKGLWACGCFECNLFKTSYDHGKAVDEWEDFGAEYNNGWIPCTDRLPTAEEYQRGNGRFLVTDGNRTYEAEFDIYESHTFGKSRMATDWFVTDKCVTHWQNEPLPPKPYQSKGE